EPRGAWLTRATGRHARQPRGPRWPRACGHAAPRVPRRRGCRRAVGDAHRGDLMSWVTSRARPDIVALEPYRHAAWEPGLARLHANELPWRTPGDDSQDGLNRYPEPQPRALIERLAALYRSPTETLLATRGSDEAIDLLTRAFCRAGEDAVVVCPPTFGVYAAARRISRSCVPCRRRTASPGRASAR